MEGEAMSEFTSGFLIEHKHASKIEKYAQKGAVLKRINKKWTAYLTPKDDPSEVVDMSMELPVLYFNHAEDHGWEYQIFHEGKRIAHLYIDYEMDEGVILKLAQERYPDKDPIELLYLCGDTNIMEELRSEVTDHFETLVHRLFQDANVECLSIFDIKAENMKELKLVLSQSGLFSSTSRFALVDAFKKNMQLEEMSWIRYDRIEEQGDYDRKFE